MTVPKFRVLTLGLAALAAAFGVILTVHDGILLATGIAAVGLVFTTRERRALALAAVFLGGGLFWSSLDVTGCSVWFRGKLLLSKLRAELRDASWEDVGRYVVSFSHCYTPYWPRHLGNRVVNGAEIELYDTAIGKIWIPKPGKQLLRLLLTEIYVGRDYEAGDITIKAGDTVIDCGAHVGVFTKYALSSGAGTVVAIEPDPTNIVCFEANLAEEIQSGQVILAKVGVWNEASELMFVHNKNSGSHSFVRRDRDFSVVGKLPVRPLDDIVEESALDRVDLIKMDIEGAERFALMGAKRTIEQFHPKMAICTYHLPDDSRTLSTLVDKTYPDYEIVHKDFIEVTAGQLGPKVTFLQLRRNVTP